MTTPNSEMADRLAVPEPASKTDIVEALTSNPETRRKLLSPHAMDWTDGFARLVMEDGEETGHY